MNYTLLDMRQAVKKEASLCLILQTAMMVVVEKATS